jgi:hypothetical protein
MRVWCATRAVCTDSTSLVGSPRGARGNLRLAASETLALARSGPLPELVTERRASFPLKVIPVSRPADLVPGQRRLVELLQRVTMVRPEHAQQVAIANARTCLAVARLATSDVDQRGLAAAMRKPRRAARCSHCPPMSRRQP